MVILESDVIPFSMVPRLITPEIHKTIVSNIKILNPPISLVPILMFFSFIINNPLNDYDSFYFIALSFPFLWLSLHLLYLISSYYAKKFFMYLF